MLKDRDKCLSVSVFLGYKNIHMHLREDYWKFQGGGVTKAKPFNKSNELKLEFPLI